MAKVQLSEQQREAFYRDGFLILRDVIDVDAVTAARRNLYQRLGQLRLRALGNKTQAIQESARATLGTGEDPLFSDLFNRSGVKPSIENLFGGPIAPAKGAQIAANFPTDPSERTNESGYRDCDTPFRGWVAHLDGLWNGGTLPPPVGKKLTPHQRRKWYQSPSTNGVARSYPEQNSNITNFGALVGIPLSDQRKEGVGNLGVLKGAHHVMEKIFQQQWAEGGPLGPDGPGWVRENADAPNGYGLRHIPDQLREHFKRGAEQTPDGYSWPKPTLVKVKPGDAVIVHFALPHDATRVEGADPRLMLYFRTTPRRRQEAYRAAYPKALTDIWHEWRGMRDTVKRLT